MTAANGGDAVLDFYFDVISPYSYIGFEALLRYLPQLPAKVNLKPAYLHGIFKGASNVSPIYNKAKNDYITQDLVIAARYWHVPIRFPEEFIEVFVNRGSLKAHRFLVALKLQHPEFLNKTTLDFFKAVYERDEPIYLEEHVRKIATKLGFSDVDKLIQESETEEVKALVEQYTKDAIDSGGFGAPWAVLRQPGKEDLHFFGSDRLPYILNELGVEFIGPFPKK